MTQEEIKNKQLIKEWIKSQSLHIESTKAGIKIMIAPASKEDRLLVLEILREVTPKI